MSTETATEFTRAMGGGVKIAYSRLVSQRRLLNDVAARDHLRGSLRYEVIKNLSKVTKLPFHLAIVNITTWDESVVDVDSISGFPPSAAYEDQPVMMIVTAYVREVRYIPEDQPKEE